MLEKKRTKNKRNRGHSRKWIFFIFIVLVVLVGVGFIFIKKHFQPTIQPRQSVVAAVPTNTNDLQLAILKSELSDKDIEYSRIETTQSEYIIYL